MEKKIDNEGMKIEVSDRLLPQVLDAKYLHWEVTLPVLIKERANTVIKHILSNLALHRAVIFCLWDLTSVLWSTTPS